MPVATNHRAVPVTTAKAMPAVANAIAVEKLPDARDPAANAAATAAIGHRFRRPAPAQAPLAPRGRDHAPGRATRHDRRVDEHVAEGVRIADRGRRPAAGRVEALL